MNTKLKEKLKEKNKILSNMKYYHDELSSTVE